MGRLLGARGLYPLSLILSLTHSHAISLSDKVKVTLITVTVSQITEVTPNS